MLGTLLHTFKQSIKKYYNILVNNLTSEEKDFQDFVKSIHNTNTVYIETTSACNLNCTMCPTQRDNIKMHKPDGFMKISLFEKIINDLSINFPQARVLLHKDGEPLLHPDIVQMIQYSSNRLNDVTLVTNATLLDEQMSRAILETNLQYILFSVDGNSPDTYNKIRVQSKNNPFKNLVPTDYDNVVKNIERFIEIKKEVGSSILHTTVRTTMLAKTKKEIPQYKEYWKGKVDSVKVAELISWAGEIKKDRNQHERVACHHLWRKMTIAFDGKMNPCCSYVDVSGTKKGDYDDITRKSISEILKGENLKKLRIAQLNNELEDLMPYCINCTDWKLNQGYNIKRQKEVNKLFEKITYNIQR